MPLAFSVVIVVVPEFGNTAILGPAMLSVAIVGFPTNVIGLPDDTAAANETVPQLVALVEILKLRAPLPVNEIVEEVAAKVRFEILAALNVAPFALNV